MFRIWFYFESVSESGEMCAMKEVTLFSDDAKSKESAKQLMQASFCKNMINVIACLYILLSSPSIVIEISSILERSLDSSFWFYRKLLYWAACGIQTLCSTMDLRRYVFCQYSFILYIWWLILTYLFCYNILAFIYLRIHSLVMTISD